MDFKLFLLENEAEQAAAQMQDKIKGVADPANIQKMLQTLGVNSIQSVDDLTKKIKSHPQFQQIVQLYQKAKTQQPPQPQAAPGQPGQVPMAQEGVQFDEGFWSAVGNIFNGLFGIVKWAIGSIAKTVHHVLAPLLPSFLGGAEGKGKLQYLAMALLTFGLCPYFLAIGAPAAAAGTVGWSATWWSLMWFGKNILEPTLIASGA